MKAERHYFEIGTCATNCQAEWRKTRGAVQSKSVELPLAISHEVVSNQQSVSELPRSQGTNHTDCVRDQALLHHPTRESMPGLPGVLREGENIRIGVKFNTTLHVLAFGMLSFTCAIVNLYGYYIIMLFLTNEK